MRTRCLATAIAFALTACALPVADRAGRMAPAATSTARPVAPPAAATVAVDYTYQLLTPEVTGLAQVFDDGRHTFLSFSGLVPTGLMIFDENGRTMAFSATGATVFIDAVRRGWLIRTPTRSSYAQARALERVARLEAVGSEGEDSIDLPTELAAARAEILALQQRLVGVSIELDQGAQREGAPALSSLKLELEAMQVRLDGVNAVLLRAHFASGSVVLRLSTASRRILIEGALRAQAVQIRAGADSTGSAALNVWVALARAQALREVLVAGGVDGAKVQARVVSEYVATNATAVGRAANRRADVVFIADETDVPATSRLSTMSPVGGR